MCVFMYVYTYTYIHIYTYREREKERERETERERDRERERERREREMCIARHGDLVMLPCLVRVLARRAASASKPSRFLCTLCSS